MSKWFKIGITVLALAMFASSATGVLAGKPPWAGGGGRPNDPASLDVVKTVDNFFTFRERSDPGDPDTATGNIGLGWNGQIFVFNTGEAVAEFTDCIDFLEFNLGGGFNVDYPNDDPGLPFLPSLLPYVLQEGVFIWPACEGFMLGPGQWETFGYVIKISCSTLESFDPDARRMRNNIVIEVNDDDLYGSRSASQDLKNAHHACADNLGIP
jgi:hypothetical protein